jgi:hypothetical protein
MYLVAILDAILNISISPRVPGWHPVDSQSGPPRESKSAENNNAPNFALLCPKFAFGNPTTNNSGQNNPDTRKSMDMFQRRRLIMGILKSTIFGCIICCFRDE